MAARALPACDYNTRGDKLMRSLCSQIVLTFICLALLGTGVMLVAEAQQERKLGYTDTPFLPGGKWRVHDGNRPQPKIIDPGTSSTPEAAGRPPSDAIVLF